MKTTISFSIEPSIKEAYIKYCDDNFINKSAIIEDLIDQFLTSKSLTKNENPQDSQTGGNNKVRCKSRN